MLLTTCGEMFRYGLFGGRVLEIACLVRLNSKLTKDVGHVLEVDPDALKRKSFDVQSRTVEHQRVNHSTRTLRHRTDGPGLEDIWRPAHICLGLAIAEFAWDVVEDNGLGHWSAVRGSGRQADDLEARISLALYTRRCLDL